MRSAWWHNWLVFKHNGWSSSAVGENRLWHRRLQKISRRLGLRLRLWRTNLPKFKSWKTILLRKKHACFNKTSWRGVGDKLKRERERTSARSCWLCWLCKQLSNFIYLVKRVYCWWLGTIFLIATCPPNHVMWTDSRHFYNERCARNYASCIFYRLQNFLADDGSIWMWLSRRCRLNKVSLTLKLNALTIIVNITTSNRKNLWATSFLSRNVKRRSDSWTIANLPLSIYKVYDFLAYNFQLTFKHSKGKTASFSWWKSITDTVWSLSLVWMRASWIAE